jgi:hypothetical protein
MASDYQMCVLDIYLKRWMHMHTHQPIISGVKPGLSYSCWLIDMWSVDWQMHQLYKIVRAKTVTHF